MKELPQAPIDKRELARTTTALYPEFSGQFELAELKKIFFERCEQAGKNSREGMYGSPNHGLQFPIYRGESVLYRYDQENPTQLKESWKNLNDLMRDVQQRTVVLFTYEDVLTANTIGALPKEMTAMLPEIESLIAKDQGNGIILIPATEG